MTGFDEWLEHAKHRVVAVAKLPLWQLSIDRDERVEAPEAAPRRRDDPRQRLVWVAALGLRALITCVTSVIARSVTAAMSASRVGK